MDYEKMISSMRRSQSDYVSDAERRIDEMTHALIVLDPPPIQIASSPPKGQRKAILEARRKMKSMTESEDDGSTVSGETSDAETSVPSGSPEQSEEDTSDESQAGGASQADVSTYAPFEVHDPVRIDPRFLADRKEPDPEPEERRESLEFEETKDEEPEQEKGGFFGRMIKKIFR